MRILVIGDGALGTEIKQQASSRGHTVFQTSRKNPSLIQIDLAKEIDISGIPQTDWTVIAAGISGYRECEENKLSRIVNVNNTISLCKKIFERGNRVLFSSTTAVFDGSKAFPSTDDSTCPDTEYGRQKEEVEHFLHQDRKGLTLRFSKMFGNDNSLVSGWIKNIQQNKTIEAFSDLSLAPVLYEEAALASCMLMESKSSGIFHCSGPEELSYYNFANRLCKRAGFSTRLVQPASCKNKLSYCPAHSSLDTSATNKLLKMGFMSPDKIIAKLLSKNGVMCG